MSDADDIGVLIGGLLVIAGIVILVIIIFHAAMFMAGVGALIGAGTSIRNYLISFKNNVKPVVI